MWEIVLLAPLVQQVVFRVQGKKEEVESGRPSLRSPGNSHADAINLRQQLADKETGDSVKRSQQTWFQFVALCN